MWIDTPVGSEREPHPRGRVNQLHVAFLLGFLWSGIFLSLALSPYLVYLRFLPCGRTYIPLSQDGFYQRSLWGDAPRF